MRAFFLRMIRHSRPSLLVSAVQQIVQTPKEKMDSRYLLTQNRE